MATLQKGWIGAYIVTLGNKKAYKTRLQELETWDTCNGNAAERSRKIAALKFLIAQ